MTYNNILKVLNSKWRVEVLDFPSHCSELRDFCRGNRGRIISNSAKEWYSRLFSDYPACVLVVEAFSTGEYIRAVNIAEMLDMIENLMIQQNEKE